MHFEVRVDPPHTSEAYARCRELYLAGRTLEAAAESLRLRKARAERTPEDFMLCSDIARSCGDYHQYQAISKVAFLKYPDNWLIGAQYARAQAGRYRLVKANRLLEELRTRVPGKAMPFLDGFLAANNAMSGFRETAEKYEKLTLEKTDGSDPLVWYELAYMASTVTNWEKAVEYGYRTLEIAPRWQRARTNLVSSLLARGRSDEACRLIDEGLALNLEDESLDFTAGMFELARGRFDEAVRHLERHGSLWKEANTRRYVTATLAITLWEMGRYDEARKRAADCGAEMRKNFQDATPTGAHKLIPLNLVCQRTRECVPTSAAMVSAAQGVVLNLDEILKEMECRDGTPVWKMCDVMQAKGFRTVCVNAGPEIIRTFLDRGIPLIGTLEGFFSSHVEVICGYARDLSLFYIRDPSMWYPYAIHEEDLKNRYSLHANSVVAMIAPEKNGDGFVRDEWISADGTNLRVLAKACSKGDLKTAEAAYAAIPDTSKAAFLRNVTGVRITITPARFTQAMTRLAFDASADVFVRGKALLCLRTPESVRELARLAADNNWGYFMCRYADILGCLQDCRWADACSALESLLEKQPGMEMLWSYHADVKAEMGDLAEAQESLRKALEISPFSVSLKEKGIRLHMDQQPYAGQLGELQEVMKSNHDAHYLKYLLATVLANGSDGLEYEKAQKACLAFFPRDPCLYHDLANWYLYQSREDLAGSVLERGRALMGEEEVSLYEFETKAMKRATPPPVPTHDAKEQLFLDAERLLAECHYDCAVDSLAPVAQLVQMDGARKLAWYDSARLLAMRLAAHLYRPGREPDVAKIAEILPSKMTGPVTVAVTTVLHRFDYSMMNRAAAVILYDWATRITADSKKTKNLKFYTALLLERSGRVQDAIAEYESMKKEYPGDPGVLYRVGESHWQQGKIVEAIEAYENSLKVAPGLSGAMARLINLYDQVGQSGKAAEWEKSLCRLFPYHYDNFAQCIYRIEREQGAMKAVEAAGSAAGGLHRRGSLDALKAYLLARAGKHDESAAALAGGEAEKVNEYLAVYARFISAIEKKESARIEELSKYGMEKWPGAVWFLQEYACIVAKKNEAEARKLLRNAILQGNINEDLADLYVRTAPACAEEAMEIIPKVPQQHRDHVVAMFARAFMAAERHNDNIKFLLWCNVNVKHLTYLRERLIGLLDVSNRCTEARKIAEELYEEDKDDPARLGLMGRCVQNTDPREALKYLEREYKMTRSVECLRLQARSYQLLGDGPRAKELYWQAVREDPNSTISLCNLFLLGEPARQLINPVCQAIERAAGVEDQYFHASAVKVAMQTGARLPPGWIHGARARYRAMLAQGSFRDEKSVLRLAIAAWLQTWGENEEAKKYGWWFERFRSRFIWPRTAWIPPKPGPGLPFKEGSD
ncbi:MAG: hypothetical protein C0404_02120 [Verrucomicrobia bacterium]|nr:hypothetical protein [Verrucomicrobiota bacterium]